MNVNSNRLNIWKDSNQNTDHSFYLPGPESLMFGNTLGCELVKSSFLLEKSQTYLPILWKRSKWRSPFFQFSFESLLSIQSSYQILIFCVVMLNSMKLPPLYGCTGKILILLFPAFQVFLASFVYHIIKYIWKTIFL